MDLLEILDYQFMQRALLAGALVGLVCSLLGVFVVLRGLAFIGAGISHAAFAGVGLALLLGFPPLFGAFLFCSLIAVLIGHFSRLGSVREDTSIGIFFAASMAFGVLLVAFLKNPNIDLMSYLFGGILTVSDYDLYVSFVLGLVVLAILLFLYKEFVNISFDEELAAISGLPARSLSYLLLVLLALAVVVSMSLVGIILVSALIVTPAATALQLERDIDRVMITAGAIGVLSTELGLLLSFYIDSAPGPTIVVFSTLIFFVCTSYKMLFGRAG